MPSLMLLEDDPVLGQAIKIQLEVEGYDVQWEKSLKEARVKITQKKDFDLFLLDVNLPDGVGYDFCRELRDQSIKNPIVFLTARSDEESLVRGFGEGANDYIRKPFGHKELLTRIRYHLSEKKSLDDVVRFADLILVRDQQILRFNSQNIPLNRREFQILQVFFEAPNVVISRDTLIDRLGHAEDIVDRTIDSHISHIRAKLKKNGIEGVKLSSVYGSGYRLEKSK